MIYLGFTYLTYDLLIPQNSTIRPLRKVVKQVMWLVSNGWLVAEICPFQVPSRMVAGGSKAQFSLGLHYLMKM